MDNREKPQHHAVWRHCSHRYTDGFAARHQTRNGKLSRPVQTYLQVKGREHGRIDNVCWSTLLSWIFLFILLLGNCSYAGLHCVVIKGYSKSAGYQPGVRFEDNRFRNSWNAVYVAGAWRFVQCNWGARHLVNAKEVPKPGSKSKSDSLRLAYILIK